ncbi:AraC family transcriptional regulator ligand-binding domain-containing protein [Colwellia sp. D2M02]|uniref:AraC family transcriptional regulator ligand-binding domain-containing protein n=1 Tax=Colwellia sp. D2M02 TaxID=2841562 RepID=UPI001C092C21|nr:helix-turn-helix domain-containing protein [Colwellia sp. D2M02]MBU2894763.1 AraC family transcriptional regulator ligand-binding domain-containing protein [Colwellia sp. D2M02]
MKSYFEQNDKVLSSHHMLLSLVDIAKQRGVLPDVLLKGSKIFYSDLLREPLKISSEQLQKVVLNSIKLLPQGDVAFLLGRRLFPSHLGNTGNALMNCRHLADMVRVIQTQQIPLFPLLFMTIKRHKQQHFFAFNQSLTTLDTRYYHFLCEVLASALVCAIKWRLGYLPKLCFTFPYAEPDYIEQYQVNLGSDISFLNSVTQQPLQISIKSDDLYLRFCDHNQSLKRHYLNLNSSLLPCNQKAQAVGLIQYILHFIDKNNSATLEQVASSLLISTATLKRKISAHQSSYQQIIDQYKQQQAMFDITTLGLNNDKVANKLKFSDTTNFRRSFKRWTGMTPNELRQCYITNKGLTD